MGLQEWAAVATILGTAIALVAYVRPRSGDLPPSRESSRRASTVSSSPDQESEKSSKSVPPKIEFGTRLMRTPSLEELGIPPPFAYLPYIKSHVGLAEWVERGQPLVTYILVSYRLKNRLPLPLRLIFGDRTESFSFNLEAPISGFVTDLRRVLCRESRFDKFAGTFLGMFDKDAVLPTLLIPKEEPAWSSSRLEHCRREISWQIASRWQLNQHNMGGGSGRYRRIRVGDACDQGRFWSGSNDQEAQLRAAIAWAAAYENERFRQPSKWPVVEYAEYRTSYNSSLHEHIESYRANDLVLRDKLAHLTRGVSSTDD